MPLKLRLSTQVICYLSQVYSRSSPLSILGTIRNHLLSTLVFGLLANAAAHNENSFWVSFRPLAGLRLYKTKICSSLGMFDVFKAKYLLTSFQDSHVGNESQSRVEDVGTFFLRVPAHFPEVWRVGEQSQIADGWSFIHCSKAWALLSQFKIVSTKHTRGMSPAILFPYQMQWHVKLLRTTNHCIMLFPLWEGRTFTIFPCDWLQIRFVEGVLPQYRTILPCLLHGLLT